MSPEMLYFQTSGEVESDAVSCDMCQLTNLMPM